MFLIRILILLTVAYALFRMWHWKIGFTFFTQLSNLYAAAVVLLQLLSPSPFAAVLKYTAAVSVSLTFWIFLFFIAPKHPDGFFAAYRQDHYASFCFHVIVPILTVFDFLLFDAGTVLWQPRHLLFALIPPLLYGLMLLLFAVSGMRWKGRTAPYPFLDRNGPAGIFGFHIRKKPVEIGVFYVLILLLFVILLLGWILLLAASVSNPARPLFL